MCPMPRPSRRCTMHTSTAQSHARPQSHHHAGRSAAAAAPAEAQTADSSAVAEPGRPGDPLGIFGSGQPQRRPWALGSRSAAPLAHRVRVGSGGRVAPGASDAGRGRRYRTGSGSPRHLRPGESAHVAIPLDIFLAVGAPLGAILLGLAASIYPALMAARLDPNEALRYL